MYMNFPVIVPTSRAWAAVRVNGRIMPIYAAMTYFPDFKTSRHRKKADMITASVMLKNLVATWGDRIFVSTITSDSSMMNDICIHMKTFALWRSINGADLYFCRKNVSRTPVFFAIRLPCPLNYFLKAIWYLF